MSDQQTISQPWSPPKGFIPVDSNLPGVTVYAPQPKSTGKDQARHYACPKCGATIAYDVSAGGVAC
jgi:hypothetical protein